MKTQRLGKDVRGRCIAIRFDTQVEFIVETKPGKYDPISGTYKPGESETHKRPCRIYDLGAEKKVEIYGRTDFKAYVIIHRGTVIHCEKVMLTKDGKEKPFFVLQPRQMRNRASYIISEVRPNES